MTDWMMIAPEGVFLVHPDGSRYPCALLHNGQTAAGLQEWLAIPPPGYVPDAGAQLFVDTLPGRSQVAVDLPVQLRRKV